MNEEDSINPYISTLDEVMSHKNPMNDYFHSKFDKVTNGMKFRDQESQNVTRQIAFLFYLQGHAHFKKWSATNIS